GSVSLWLNLEAVATALLGLFLFRDRLDRLGWLGAAGIVAASLLLSWGEGAAGLRAGLLVALACLCWGADNHLTALIDGISPVESTFWKGTVAGSVSLGAALLIGGTMWPPGAVAGALLVGVFAYGASIVLYISSAQQMGATRSQLVFSSAPYFGLLLAVLLLDEPLTRAQVIAGLLIGGSVLLLTFERHGHHHDHAALAHDHFHHHDDGHHVHDHDDALPGHAHSHSHEPETHVHAHLPDLHHRHEH
ncbi:MAG: DMT family transporter, partial [Caldilineaceae bacterium]